MEYTTNIVDNPELEMKKIMHGVTNIFVSMLYTCGYFSFFIVGYPEYDMTIHKSKTKKEGVELASDFLKKIGLDVIKYKETQPCFAKTSGSASRLVFEVVNNIDEVI